MLDHVVHGTPTRSQMPFAIVWRIVGNEGSWVRLMFDSVLCFAVCLKGWSSLGLKGKGEFGNIGQE